MIGLGDDHSCSTSASTVKISNRSNKAIACRIPHIRQVCSMLLPEEADRLIVLLSTLADIADPFPRKLLHDGFVEHFSQPTNVSEDLWDQFLEELKHLQGLEQQEISAQLSDMLPPAPTSRAAAPVVGAPEGDGYPRDVVATEQEEEHSDSTLTASPQRVQARNQEAGTGNVTDHTSAIREALSTLPPNSAELLAHLLRAFAQAPDPESSRSTHDFLVRPFSRLTPDGGTLQSSILAELEILQGLPSEQISAQLSNILTELLTQDAPQGAAPANPSLRNQQDHTASVLLPTSAARASAQDQEPPPVMLKPEAAAAAVQQRDSPLGPHQADVELNSLALSSDSHPSGQDDGSSGNTSSLLGLSVLSSIAEIGDSAKPSSGCNTSER